jgi:tetratricopeptide (TPR) repeat protein
MNRCRGLAKALVVGALLIPTSAFAQTNRDTNATKEAGKFIGLAMMRADTAERNQQYVGALMALEEAFTREADNARVWFIAGQAYAGLRDYVKADEAFDKAVELHPEYAEEVEGEREAAWLDGFQTGVALMDEQKPAEALAVLQGAHDLYPHRPEGLLNIGSIHANAGEIDAAVQAFEQAIVAARGPHLEKLDTAGQAQWEKFAQMAELNIAQMTGAQGVEHFQAADYAAAAAAFQKAADINPHARDYLFNIVQAHYAQATALEEARDTSIAQGSAPQDAELTRLYDELRGEIERVREFDPNNESLLAILARAERRHAELTGDMELGQQRALRVLENLRDMPVEVQDLIVTPGEAEATVQGKIMNRTLDTGAPVTVRITLLGSDGESIGEAEAKVTAPEKEATTDFQVSAPVTAQVAGWKYQVVN